MGEVYGARDTRLDRTVAVKVLPAVVASDPSARERFEREARAIAALKHPHICTLHDVGRHAGIDFLVLEFLEGETLAHRLSRGALSLQQALAVPHQRGNGRGRRYAHQHHPPMEASGDAVKTLVESEESSTGSR